MKHISKLAILLSVAAVLYLLCAVAMLTPMQNVGLYGGMALSLLLTAALFYITLHLQKVTHVNDASKDEIKSDDKDKKDDIKKDSECKDNDTQTSSDVVEKDKENSQETASHDSEKSDSNASDEASNSEDKKENSDKS